MLLSLKNFSVRNVKTEKIFILQVLYLHILHVMCAVQIKFKQNINILLYLQ